MVDVILPVPSSMRTVRVVSPETSTSIIFPTKVACRMEIGSVGSGPDGRTGPTTEKSLPPKLYRYRSLDPGLVSGSLIFA